MFSASRAPRVELQMWQPDGSPWSVAFSPGIERFIGAYPRLEGFGAGGPLLEYRTVAPIG